MPRYTGTWLSRPAGQQVPATMLFFAADDTAAGNVFDGIEAFVKKSGGGKSASHRLNKQVAGDNTPAGVVTGTVEKRAHVLFEDGSLGFFHIPHIINTKTDAEIEAAILGTGEGGVPLQNSSGSDASSVVKIELVNKQ